MNEHMLLTLKIKAMPPVHGPPCAPVKNVAAAPSPPCLMCGMETWGQSITPGLKHDNCMSPVQCAV